MRRKRLTKPRGSTVPTGSKDILDKDLPPLPDYIEPGVRILFVGINPGLRSSSLGHHFAGYSNKFWTVLHGAGLVPVPVSYRDDWRLPTWRLGLTNLISRPTAGIHDLTKEEYERGRTELLEKIHRYRPPVVAVLGMTLLPILWGTKKVPSTGMPGLQQERLLESSVFLLPNPSGRNAHYSVPAMVKLFRPLKRFL